MRAMLFESVTSKYLSKLCEIRYSHSSHFSRQSVHLNINVTVTMVIQKLFINSYIIV